MDPEQEREGSTNDIVYLKDERNNTFTLAVMIREKKKEKPTIRRKETYWCEHPGK